MARTVDIDFPGLRIGIAEYPDGPTGCTAVVLPRRSAMAVDMRGGAMSVINGHYEMVDALSLAGGSAFGLEAASGIAGALLEAAGGSTAFDRIPLVSGAIIYDFASRDNAIYPDKALGRAAFENAVEAGVMVGPVGAGRSARVGKLLAPLRAGEAAGQGAAFAQLGQSRLLVLTVVNAVGAIHDRNGQIVRGFRRPSDAADDQSSDRPDRLPFADSLAAWREAGCPPLTDPTASAAPQRSPNTTGPSPSDLAGNTTLTVVITDRRMARPELVQTGRQIHDAMARAIRPFHSMTDGDVLFMVTTGDVEADDLPPIGFAEAGAELAWDAVLNCWGDP